MRADEARTLEALRADLRSEDALVRCQAAKALGLRGPGAAAAAPALCAVLDDPDPIVRCMAAAALGKIGRAGCRANGPGPPGTGAGRSVARARARARHPG